MTANQKNSPPDEPRCRVLRFLSGGYQGSEYLLPAGREILIGRAKDRAVDMALNEDMVSRKHAKIICTGGDVEIRDLGSTNGTFVNGEKVKAARLEEGDRILIGTNILKLVYRASRATTAESVQPVMADDATRERGSEMSGRLEDVPLPDLLQLLQTSRQSGVLEIDGRGSGRVYLRDGGIHHAVIDGKDLDAGKALNRMVSWYVGAFDLRPPPDEPLPVTLEDGTEALVMEALRQLDELRRVEKDLPGRHAAIGLKTSFRHALRDLSPERLDVLQLVHEVGTIDGVIEAAKLSDLDTALHLLALLRQGYVEERG